RHCVLPHFVSRLLTSLFFLFHDPPTSAISTLSLHDALPIYHFAVHDRARNQRAHGDPRDLRFRPRVVHDHELDEAAAYVESRCDPGPIEEYHVSGSGFGLSKGVTKRRRRPSGPSTPAAGAGRPVTPTGSW